MVLILFFISLLSVSSFDSFANSVISDKDLRWQIPSNYWIYKKEYLFKGRVFQINTFTINETIKIFDNIRLAGRPILEITPYSFKQGSNEICNNYSPASYNGKVVESCAQNFCSENLKNIEHSHLNYKSLLGSDYRTITNQKCPIDLGFQFLTYYGDFSRRGPFNGFNSANSTIGMSFNFKYSKIAKNYVELFLNGKAAYLDSSICLKKGFNCKEVEIEKSEYEKDMNVLSEHKKNEDIDLLNIYIKHLKPCVTRKDINCIKKFLVTDVSDYIEESYGGYQIPNWKIDDDLIKELNACLNYESLLPHLYGLRGIKKVCVFQRRASLKIPKIPKDNFGIKLMNITYPESIRVGVEDQIIDVVDLVE